MRRTALAIALMLGLAAPVAAQAPPPVPALPDTQRLTTYSLTASTCACSVGFALYGTGTDVDHWVQVFVNGVAKLSTDPTFGWRLTSATGSLGSIPRPITNAVLTFTSAQTASVVIVGSERPRRLSQFSENRGVPARDLNQIITDTVATQRELWDKSNRAITGQPGETLNLLPSATSRIGGLMMFDGAGQPIIGSGAGVTGSFGTNNVWTGTNTFVGGITGNPINSVRYADQFPGVDIGDKINAAFADFGAAPACGTVAIPAGSYSFSTPIVISSAASFRAGCILTGLGGPVNGTALTYTGTGNAISITNNTSSSAYATLQQFSLDCSGCSAGHGITIVSASQVVVGPQVRISGFPAGKAAVHIQGLIFNIRVFNDTFINNLGSGVFIDGVSNFQNVLAIRENLFESNGEYGILVNQSAGDLSITGNELEHNQIAEIYLNSVQNGVVLGNHLEHTVCGGGVGTACFDACNSSGGPTGTIGAYANDTCPPLIIGFAGGVTNALQISGNSLNAGTSSYCVDTLGTVAYAGVSIVNNLCATPATAGYRANIITGGQIGPNAGLVLAQSVSYVLGTEGVLSVAGNTAVGGSYNWRFVDVPVSGIPLSKVTVDGAFIASTLACHAPNTQTGATYTVVTNDCSIIGNNAGATLTLTLPAAASFPGRLINIKTTQAQTIVSNASNVVPLAGGAAGTAIVSATAGRWVQLQSDATNWVIMSGVP